MATAAVPEGPVVLLTQWPVLRWLAADGSAEPRPPLAARPFLPLVEGLGQDPNEAVAQPPIEEDATDMVVEQLT